MFYEHNHSSGELYLRLLDENRDFSFPLHLHASFELLCVDEGEMTVTVGGSDFPVREGECALILPGQPHAYATAVHSICRICIFSADYLPDLHRHCAGQRHRPVFSQPVADLFDRLRERRGNIFLMKAMFYEVAGAYAAGEICGELLPEDDSLVCEIVRYIEAHYTGSVTLRDLAGQLGYNYRYLSGVVNRAFRASFPQVVSQYRVSHACGLLRVGLLPVAEVAEQSGFDSMRSFDRTFKAVTGMTPREYVKG